MSKENCQCLVCQVEQNLLDTLGTQTARSHFQALASNHQILNQFDSPADVIAELHERTEAGMFNHIACNGILQALVASIMDGRGKGLGQQLLLVAYTPAIHKSYREVRQKFPGLPPEDIAQQATLCFLETARSPEMQGLNGYLSSALAVRFRRRLFRWAIGETRQSLPLQKMIADPLDPSASSFEHAVTLETILQEAKRDGLLSEAERQLLLKFKWEGFEANELVGMNSVNTTNAVQMRLKRIIKRLHRAFKDSQPDSVGRTECRRPKNSSTEVTIFSKEMGIRKSKREFPTEISSRSLTLRTRDQVGSTAMTRRSVARKNRKCLARFMAKGVAAAPL